MDMIYASLDESKDFFDKLLASRSFKQAEILLLASDPRLVNTAVIVRSIGFRARCVNGRKEPYKPPQNVMRTEVDYCSPNAHRDLKGDVEYLNGKVELFFDLERGLELLGVKPRRRVSRFL